MGDEQSVISSDDVPKRVRFAVETEEVIEIRYLSRDALVGCRKEETNWLEMATRRKERFRLRCHSQKLCSRRGQQCWCDREGGVCTAGGHLESETGVTLQAAFQAWRIHQGIPATVPLML